MPTTTRQTATAIGMFADVERARFRLARLEAELGDYLAAERDAIEMAEYVAITDEVSERTEQVLARDDLAWSTRSQYLSTALSMVNGTPRR